MRDQTTQHFAHCRHVQVITQLSPSREGVSRAVAVHFQAQGGGFVDGSAHFAVLEFNIGHGLLFMPRIEESSVARGLQEMNGLKHNRAYFTPPLLTFLSQVYAHLQITRTHVVRNGSRTREEKKRYLTSRKKNHSGKC